MMRKACCLGVLVAAGVALDAAAVSNQVETLLYDTHQKVTNLDKNLDGAVKKLNDTTSELLERVNESENQTRQLRSLVEENQVKLDTLQQQLGQLTATVYQQFNLTAGTGYAPAAPSGGSIVIEPPADADSVESVDPVETSTPPASSVTPAGAQSAYQDAQKAWLAQDYPSALRMFSDYLVRYPNTELSGYAQYWQGRCYLKLEQYQEAIDSLEKVRLNYPDNDSKVSQAMQSQAVALSRLGRNEEAKRLLEEVVRRYPGTVVARQAQSDLEKLQGN